MTPTDHDLLIKLCQQMDMMTMLLTNHLHHHFIYNVTLLGGFISTVTALSLYWVKARNRDGNAKE